MDDSTIEGMLRRLTPQVIGALVRRYGHFDSAEDAVHHRSPNARPGSTPSCTCCI